MEQKMAPGTGLSLRQKQFLDLVLQTDNILKRFYLSGGTALSSWYLHHRESYDLDFFSDRPFDRENVARLIRLNQDVLDYQSVSANDDFGLYCILKKTDWKIDRLLKDADKKFSITTDVLYTAKNFLKSSEIANYPKMLVPFDKKGFFAFYEKLANSFKSKILK